MMIRSLHQTMLCQDIACIILCKLPSLRLDHGRPRANVSAILTDQHCIKRYFLRNMFQVVV